MINNEDKQLTKVMDQLAEYGASDRFESSFEQAWECIEKLYDEDELSIEDQKRMRHLFIFPWHLFQWTAYRYQTDEDFEIDSDEQPVAFHFLQENKHALSDYQQDFITQMLNTHYSFYAVVEHTPDNKAVFLDILLGTRYSILKTYSTQSFELGDIIFGCMFRLNDQSTFLTGAPCRLAPCLKRILALRNWLIEDRGKLSSAMLRDECAYEILAEFFVMLAELLHGQYDEIEYQKNRKALKEAKWLARPEVQKKLLAAQRENLAEWPDRRMKELNGLTPRKAIETNIGKTIVESLLLEWEIKRPLHPNLRPDITSLRKDLGLEG